MGMRVRLALRLALLALAACVPQEGAVDYGDPTSLATPTEDDGIIAWVVSPGLGDELETATPEIVIGAHTKDEPYKPLHVFIGRLEKDASGVDRAVDLRQAEPDGKASEKQRFRLEVPLTHGSNRLLVRIETQDRTRVRRIVYPLVYAGDKPGLTLSVRVPSEQALLDGDVCSETRESTGHVFAAKVVCVSGNVTTLDGVSAAAVVRLSGGERIKAKLSKDGRFALGLTLPVDSKSVIEAEIRDESERTTTARVSVIQDSKPPSLDITSLVRETTQAAIEIEGKVRDRYGIDAIELETDTGAIQRIGNSSPFSAQVRLAVGANNVTVVARDIAGNEARERLTLSRVRTLWLDQPKRDVGVSQIEVDRFALDDLLTPADQQSLSLVSIDLAPPVKQALERIREPERFGVDTSGWGDAERNMQRLLNMTPDNADLTGTSVEKLLEIAGAVGLPPQRMLAEILDVGVTDFLVAPDTTAEVLLDQLIGTHPAVQRDATGAYVIDVSMYDVFQDMRTIAPRFGPSGNHPGFLEGASEAVVIEPGFQMTLPVRSNLVQYDAVDLSRASKDFLFLLEGERVLDFNVLTDEFVVVGLKDEPTVNLRFGIKEHPGPGLLLAGATQNTGADAANPGFFRGNGQGYGVAPWLFEHIAVETGYRMYAKSFAADGYTRRTAYDAGQISDAAVIQWNRGWLTITTAGGLGSPPAPLYAWDLLMEVAQVRLHDNGIPEGQANMAFSLEQLSIGLTADQLIEKLRPRLAEQETKLSELLVGDQGLASSRADFFYVPAEGREGVLLYRAPGDVEGEYTYQRPGFFSDAKLTDKVSTAEVTAGVSGEVHEMAPATLGAVYYAGDDTNAVYQLEVVARDKQRIGVRVTQVQDIQ